MLTIQDKLYECRTTGKLKSNDKRVCVDADELLSNVAPPFFSSHVFSPSLIALDADADNWQDAIRSCGNLLIKAGFTDENQVQAMIDNVLLNGPYFVFWPGVALAHTISQPPGTTFSASLIRLKNPVAFGHEKNDPVKYVITFIGSDCKENEYKILTTINLASNPILFQQLDRADTVQMAQMIMMHFEQQM